MANFFLSLPERMPALAEVIETDPKKVKDWLISLPITHVLEAGKQILEPLSALNRVQLPVDERAHLLEHYQTSLELLIGGFEVAYASAGVPMKDQARQAGLLARNLWQELAIGWKIVLVDRLEKRSFFGGNKGVPQYVANVLRAYWRLYLVCCRLYMPLPDRVWLELHQLFMLAAEGKYLDEPAEPVNGTIAILYKRFVLLALVDPLRFSALEFDRVLDVIEHYGLYAHFVSTQRHKPGVGCFLIELDLDRPPAYVGQRDLSEIGERSILFDTADLIRHLRKVEIAVEAKTPQAANRERVQEKLEILRRVIVQWTIAPHRLFPRLPASSLVEVVQGLEKVASLLRAERPVDADFDRWQVINESPGGYALRGVKIHEESTRSGQIVAVRAPGAPGWQVAAIRWLQQHDDGVVEIGLQILSAQPQPVMLSPVVEGTGPLAKDALLLPAIVAVKQTQRLLAPKGFYTPLREIRLSASDGEQWVRTGRMLEQQMGFDLFEFEWLEAQSS
jgi:cyclic-di-GMP-binding protein